MYVRCDILCLFSALSHRVGALEMSTIIIIVVEKHQTNLRSTAPGKACNAKAMVAYRVHFL